MINTLASITFGGVIGFGLATAMVFASRREDDAALALMREENRDLRRRLNSLWPDVSEAHRVGFASGSAVTEALIRQLPSVPAGFKPDAVAAMEAHPSVAA